MDRDGRRRPSGATIAAGALGAGALGFLLTGSSARARARRREAEPLPPDLAEDEVVEIITRTAEDYKILPQAALLWADLESALHPNAIGDKRWARLNPDKYQRFVVERDEYQDNPWRDDPDRWASYGLFQLLSPYWLLRTSNPSADPRILLDPGLNARLWMRHLFVPLIEKHGDVFTARLMYVCDRPGGCSEAKLNRNVRRLANAAPEWGFDVSCEEIARIAEDAGLGPVTACEGRA